MVHVVHSGEPLGSINNPSDAGIIGAINYMNDVFAGIHPTLDPSGAGDIQLPTISPNRLDGVVMVTNSMDSLKKLLVHEVGHAFNLYHVFEGSDNSTRRLGSFLGIYKKDVCVYS